jgi:hypothetical protein
MKRREFITLLGSAAAAWPLGARAQQGDRLRRIGVLTGTAAGDIEAQARNVAFLQGLAQLGWTDGRNVRIDYRFGAGNADNIRKHAAELVAARAGRHPGHWWGCRWDVTPDEPHRADRVRDRPRSSRLRLRQ